MARQFFSLRYLWFNFRAYFLEPVRWSHRSPFVRDIAVPHFPEGHGAVEHPFGILSNIPVVWLALALPLAWRGRTRESRSLLHGFIAVAAVFLGVCVLITDLYYYTVYRFETEMLPTLVLLAVIGILGLDRALAPTSESGLADRPVWRQAARCGWGLLLGFSVAFNLLASLEYYAEAQNGLGDDLFQAGKLSEAVGHFQRALRINPDYADAHESLGNVLAQTGRQPEAMVQYDQVLRLNPDYVEAHCNLGVMLLQAGRLPEAMWHWEQALRIDPDQVEVLDNLGAALIRLGRVPEAIARYQQALRINPDDAEARNALAHLQSRP
jgi:tetratricopeptide (TPR) repeat protein